MLIQEQIKRDMTVAIKAGDSKTTSFLKCILGEFNRLKGLKDGKEYISNVLTDIQASKVIRKLITDEETLLSYIDSEKDTCFLNILKSYLPEQPDENEIIDWIVKNVDFPQLKNKMQAIGLVKKQFPNIDGKMVNKIILGKF